MFEPGQLVRFRLGGRELIKLVKKHPNNNWTIQYSDGLISQPWWNENDFEPLTEEDKLELL